MLLSYDGGPYKGWQPNPLLPTVGGVVAACLERAGVGASPFGASRTDAGVHAEGQVVSLTTRADLAPRALFSALSAELPSTIALRALEVVPRSFHAHWSSVGKIYRYRLTARAEARALWLEQLGALDLGRLLLGLRLLAGAVDLSPFVPSEKGARRRALKSAELIAYSAYDAELQFTAEGFGKHQIRHMVGALLALALGDLDPRAFGRLLRGAHPLSMRAPAEGLTLHRVLYPPGLDPFGLVRPTAASALLRS